MKINKKCFMYLLCSLGATLSISPTQAILDKIGLENYKNHGQKLKELAKDVLAKDGYKLDLNKPIVPVIMARFSKLLIKMEIQ